MHNKIKYIFLEPLLLKAAIYFSVTDTSWIANTLNFETSCVVLANGDEFAECNWPGKGFHVN